MNTGEVKGFSMRKELPTGKRELGHPKERHKEKGGTTHERERWFSRTGLVSVQVTNQSTFHNGVLKWFLLRVRKRDA